MNSIFSKKTKEEKTIYDTMSSLSHTKWNCKYHIVFTPKYRRKIFYGQKRLEIGKILRDISEWQEVKIIEAEVCPDHIHMFVEIPGLSTLFYTIFIRTFFYIQLVLNN